MYPAICIITVVALISGVIAAAAQTGNIIVSSSIYLATVTVQYTNNVGATVINIYNGTTRGMHVVALDRDVGNITNSGAFDVLGYISEVDRLFTFINSIPDGEILCFAIRDEATTNLNNRSIFQQLGSQYIGIISFRSFWNFVVVKGGEVIGENYVLDPYIYWPPPLTLNVSFQLPISAPYNITALNITSTSVTLTWNIPLYYPTVILKYTVNYYPDGNIGSSMEASTTDSTTMLVISGLSGGTLYTFTVRVGTEGGGVSSTSIPFHATTLKDEPADQMSTIIAIGSALAAAFIILILLLLVVIVTALLVQRKWRTARTTHHKDQSNDVKSFYMDTCPAYEMSRAPSNVSEDLYI